MKNFIILVFLLVSSCVFAQKDSISAVEQDMINQINILRTNPKSYIPHLETYMEEHIGFLTDSEIVVVNDVIKELNKTKPVRGLIKCDYVDSITKSHLKRLRIEDKFCVECASDSTLNYRFKHLKIKYVGENLITSTEPIESIVFLLIMNSDTRERLLYRKWRYISVAIDEDISIQDFAY
jgi:hypothetical protein